MLYRELVVEGVLSSLVFRTESSTFDGIRFEVVSLMTTLPRSPTNDRGVFRCGRLEMVCGFDDDLVSSV